MHVKRTLYYFVPDDFSGDSVLDFIKTKGFTHPVIKLLKKHPGNVLVNGNIVALWNKVSIGDLVTLKIIEETSSINIVANKVPIDILYEDADLLIVNKPANMAIHPSIGHRNDTLANALSYYFKEKNEPFKYRCITRLDMNTSGLVIIAKHIFSASLLNKMMETRSIKRTYLAVCEGDLKDEGVIDAPIGRKDGSIIERCVTNTGQSAKTIYKKISYKDGYSAAQINLLTGRTHQIRVHFKYIGHPLPGDFLYENAII